LLHGLVLWMLSGRVGQVLGVLKTLVWTAGSYGIGCQIASLATSQTNSANGIAKMMAMQAPKTSRNTQSRQVCLCGSAMERVSRR